MGVDGARGGGLALSHQLGGLHADGYADPAALLDAHADKQVIAVDIPLGLRCSGPRQADLLAHKFVGGHRASSVFASPVRGILASTSQREASALHRSIDGRGFGAQAYGLLPKIRQWDTCLQADAYWRARVYEVHPEVSFAALNGGAGQGLWQSKKCEPVVKGVWSCWLGSMAWKRSRHCSRPCRVDWLPGRMCSMRWWLSGALPALQPVWPPACRHRPNRIRPVCAWPSTFDCTCNLLAEEPLR